MKYTPFAKIGQFAVLGILGVLAGGGIYIVIAILPMLFMMADPWEIEINKFQIVVGQYLGRRVIIDKDKIKGMSFIRYSRNERMLHIDAEGKYHRISVNYFEEEELLKGITNFSEENEIKFDIINKY